jgi:UDP-GlcNAc3NAcA epimerase
LDSEFILVTCHRAENTDDYDRLLSIVSALNELSETISIVLPIHPRTKIKLKNLHIPLSNKVIVIDPVGYLQMIWLIDNCKLVITDSGGLQKEAFFFSKNCITMRDETEWRELVDYNYNILVGADRESILNAYFAHSFANNFGRDLYGAGEASRLIVETLMEDRQ